VSGKHVSNNGHWHICSVHCGTTLLKVANQEEKNADHLVPPLDLPTEYYPFKRRQVPVGHPVVLLFPCISRGKLFALMVFCYLKVERILLLLFMRSRTVRYLAKRSLLAINWISFWPFNLVQKISQHVWSSQSLSVNATKWMYFGCC